MRRLGIRGVTWLGLAAVAPACGGPTPDPVAPDADVVLVADEETRAPLLGHPALAMLPDDTEVAVIVRDVRSLTELLRYDELRRKYASLLEPASAEVTKELGENLMVIDGFERIGIDASHPWGFAWIDSKDEVGCAFAKLDDPEAFKSWFYRLGALHRFDVEAETEGDALILKNDDERDVVLVLTGGYVFVVVGDRSAESVLQHARAIRPGKRSLAADPRFQRLKEREVPGDLALYVAAPRLVEAFGVPSLGVRAIPVVGDVDGAVLSASLGPKHASLRGFIGVDSERLLARALRAGDLARVHTVDVGPAVVVAVHAEPEHLSAAFDAVVSLDEDPARVRKKILRETGLDLDRDVFPALSGDAGFIHRRSIPDGPDDYPRSRVTVTLGLSDVARGKQVAAKIAAQTNKDPEVRVIGDQLVVSDDVEAMRQLSAAKSLYTPQGLAVPDAVFTSNAFTLRLDAEVVAQELFGFGHRWMEDTAKAAPVLAVDTGTDTPEVRAILARIQKLEAQQDAIREQLDRSYERERKAEHEAAAEIAEASGSSVLSLRPAPGGFEVHGGQFIRDRDGAALLDRVLGIVAAMQKREDARERESEKLYEQIRAIDEQLSQQREALRKARQGLEGGGVAKPIR